MGIKKKHVPGCSCCGEGCCSGEPPESFLLTVSGMGHFSGPFDQCNNLNGTFTLTQTDSPSSGGGSWNYVSSACINGLICYWQSESFFLDSSEASGTEVRWVLAIIKCTDGSWTVYLHLPFFNGDDSLQNPYRSQFHQTYESAPVCAEFDAEDLPSTTDVGFGGICDYNGNADLTAI